MTDNEGGRSANQGDETETTGGMDGTPPVVDLRVEFGRSPGGSPTAIVTHGTCVAKVSLALPSLELEIERLATRGGDHLPPPMKSVQADAETIGRRLFDSVFTAGARDVYDGALRSANKTSSHIRITLAFEDAPQLLTLPWEAICDDPVFLATQPEISIVREVQSKHTTQPLLVRGVVRILGVTSSPKGYDPIDCEAERRRIEKELDSLTQGGMAEITWLEPPTSENLQQRLKEGFHILHYVGHSLGPGDTEAALILEGDHKEAQKVTASSLANMVGLRNTLRLAVFNSCSSAAVTVSDPFSAIATKLVAVGVPAVVAMQIPISLGAAVEFAAGLYRSMILDEAPVEEAVSSGRLAVLRTGHAVDWLAPVLFVSPHDTHLFDLSLVGWYTLNGTPPPKKPSWQTLGAIGNGAGLLGVSVLDPVSRAIDLLGPPDDTSEYERKMRFGRQTVATRHWQLATYARVFVEQIRGGDNRVLALEVAIDVDNPGKFRAWLPGGLLLGEATLSETTDAMGSLWRKRDAMVHNRQVKDEPQRRLLPEIRREGMPEAFLMEHWTFPFPSPTNTQITFGTATSAGRWESPPPWFTHNLDLATRPIGSCRIELTDMVDVEELELRAATEGSTKNPTRVGGS